MPELAGFDVIGEVHLDTVVDLVNLAPVTNPVDGKAIYLFGGPFSTDLNVDLGSDQAGLFARDELAHLFRVRPELAELALLDPVRRDEDERLRQRSLLPLVTAAA
jgi:hypothetical protein